VLGVKRDVAVRGIYVRGGCTKEGGEWGKRKKLAHAERKSSIL